MSPLVTVIVVNWNGGEMFNRCLKTLSQINYTNWELILVDNGSLDGSGNLFNKYLNLKKRSLLIENKENLGFATANNQAYKKAKGEYILLLNNDTKISTNILSVLVKKMEQDFSIGVLQPKIKLMDKPNYLDNAGSFFTKIGFLKHWGFLQKDGKQFNKETEIFSAKGACMMVRAGVIKKVGLFDGSFFSYFEESDFCWRVWLAGYRVLYYPKIHIYHKVGFTIKKLNVFNINYHYYKNRICSLIKNLETKNLFLVLPLHLVISIGISLLFLIRRQPKNSFMIINAITWNLTNIDSILKRRTSVQNMRVVSDEAIFKKFSRPINWNQYLKDFKRVEKDLKT